MGGVDTGGDEKSVDVHLNIVPFIDLLSCLTAFLLVTAVWSNLAQITIKPKGVARSAEPTLEEAFQLKADVFDVELTLFIHDLARGNRVAGYPRNCFAFEDIKVDVRVMCCS